MSRSNQQGAPAQSPAPIAAAARKLGSGMRSEPAMGGATVENPGTNSATTSDHTPQRRKRGSVCVTQEPGLIDNRHRADSTR